MEMELLIGEKNDKNDELKLFSHKLFDNHLVPSGLLAPNIFHTTLLFEFIEAALDSAL